MIEGIPLNSSAAPYWCCWFISPTHSARLRCATCPHGGGHSAQELPPALPGYGPNPSSSGRGMERGRHFGLRAHRWHGRCRAAVGDVLARQRIAVPWGYAGWLAVRWTVRQTRRLLP